MRLPSTDREAIDRLKNHFLGKQIPGVGTWGELDALRGWKDDFLGDSLHEQYTLVAAEGGVIPTLLGGIHGGCVRLNVTAVANSNSQLWLGNGADGYATLDADEGWVAICRFRLSTFGASKISVFGVRNSANNRQICAGLYGANNWLLIGTDGVGWSVDSGLACDTDWHWHVIQAYPTSTGRRVDYWIDGTLYCSRTANIPTEVLTPCAEAWSAVAVAGPNFDIDYIAWIPRNLVA